MAEESAKSGSGTGTGSRFEEFGRKVDARVNQAVPRVEEEVRRVIAYLNDEVVPEVRRNSSGALRSAAEQLTRLAERLDGGARAGEEGRDAAGPDAAQPGAARSGGAQ